MSFSFQSVKFQSCTYHALEFVAQFSSSPAFSAALAALLCTVTQNKVRALIFNFYAVYITHNVDT